MKNRTAFLIIALFAVALHVRAQELNSGCFTMERAFLYAASDSVYAQQLRNLSQELPPPNRDANMVITVPVVVHVVYNNSAENIDLAQIQSGIDVLNEDYRRSNPDWTYTNSNYVNLAADCEINFCLVAVNRVYTSYTQFPVNSSLWTYGDVDYVKDISPGYGQGYLNIWICDIQSLLGYAVFPGMAPAQYDGVTVDYQYFGETGAALPGYAGRTATHEVGHWFGLFHIWGMQNGTYGSYCDDDYVGDTWPQHRANPNPCNYDATSCPNYGPGYYGPYYGMNENFMDYTQGSCMTFFTAGQKQRMWAAINTYRPYLVNTPIPCNTSIAEHVSPSADGVYNDLLNELIFTTSIACEDAALELYDGSGKQVYTDHLQGPGQTVFHFSLPPMAAGIYFYTFTFDGISGRNKFAILR